MNKLLANIFNNGMVLQRNKDILFWGKSKPNLPITLNFNNNIYTTTTDSSGYWEINNPAIPAGNTYILEVTDGQITQTVNNILIGDVWLCSGQSNMEINMLRTKRMFGELNNTVTNPNIRKYHVPMNYKFDGPTDEVPETEWISVEPGQLEKFSATAYFFANKLYEETKIPQGIILSALGGTPIESWMGRDLLTEFPELLNKVNLCNQAGYMEQRRFEGQKITDRWFENISKFDRGLKENWHLQNLDDSSWKTIDLDIPWDEITDLKTVGSVWLRNEIVLTKDEVNKKADIILGTIADADEVFVNGTRVGGTGYQYPPRDYQVDNFIEGKNLIVIRVLAINGTGGFTHGKEHKILFEDFTQLNITHNWKYKRALTCAPPTGGAPFFQNTPTGNYNGMIAPFHPFPIRGIVWYQGESNAGSPAGYNKLLKSLITDWREKWNDKELPVFVAQLPNWSPKGRLTNWALMRDEQYKILELSNTRVAITYDSGEFNDLHPLNKKTVGERLALEALSLVYGKNIISTSPSFSSYVLSKEELIIHFNTYSSYLTTLSDNVVHGFSVHINDIEIPVEAAITGDSVIIESDILDVITDISFAFNDDPDIANLVNEIGLPAAPFKVAIKRDRK